MKATLKINDKEIEVEISEEELKKLEEKKLPRKRWRAVKGDKYWILDDEGGYTYSDHYNETDNYFYSIGNYFKTKEEAEFYKNELIYTQMLKDYIYEHDDVELKWWDVGQEKWYLLYDFNNKVIMTNSIYTWKCQGAIYASNKQVLFDAIKFIGEENVKKYILKVEE